MTMTMMMTMVMLVVVVVLPTGPCSSHTCTLACQLSVSKALWGAEWQDQTSHGVNMVNVADFLDGFQPEAGLSQRMSSRLSK